MDYVTFLIIITFISNGILVAFTIFCLFYLSEKNINKFIIVSFSAIIIVVLVAHIGLITFEGWAYYFNKPIYLAKVIA